MILSLQDLCLTPEDCQTTTEPPTSLTLIDKKLDELSNSFTNVRPN